jgi:hypothetical protein
MRGWANRLAGRHYPAAGIVRLRRRNVEVIFLTVGFARSGIIWTGERIPFEIGDQLQRKSRLDDS